MISLVACVSNGEGESTAASESWAGPFGPVPRLSLEYQAPFLPFARCAARELAVKRTVKVAYDEEIALARLVTYERSFERRFIYALDLREKPEERVLAELSVGGFSNLQSWRGEVTRALEHCQREAGVAT